MGNVTSSNPTQNSPFWVRGERGWGTGPNVQVNNGNLQPRYSQFQQNPDPDIGETAADMFLNWVYRRIDPTPDANNSQIYTIPANLPGTWQGFLEMSWMGIDQNITQSSNIFPDMRLDPRWGDCFPSGCTDYSYPGLARYGWTNARMQLFISFRYP